MALSPAQLKRLLDNPASFSAEDMELGDDNMPEAEQMPDDGSMEIPEIDPQDELVAEAPEIADPDEVEQEKDLAAEEEDIEVEQNAQEIASDPQASMELRKKALQQIKAKYLGQ